MNDPYAMPNGVLRNKLGITDHQLLAAAEADITRARLVMLAEALTEQRIVEVGLRLEVRRGFAALAQLDGLLEKDEA